MKKIINYVVKSNKKLSNNTYKMTLNGFSKWCLPGKFFNIQIPSCFLRRPMGVFEYRNNSFSFIYKVVGKGTKKLTTYKPNDKLNILIDLGNTFKYKPSFKKPLLITGGSGLGPILSLALLFNKQRIKYDLVVGFVNKANAYYLNEIKKIQPKTIFCTDDGSLGYKGLVIDAVKHYQLQNHYYYCCGSTPMMKAVATNMKSEGQVSLDAHMGCGFGACMGCSIQTRNGWQQICKDGPIFNAKDILWDTIH